MASSGRELLQAGTSGVNVSLMDTMSQRAGPGGERDQLRTPGAGLGDKGGLGGNSSGGGGALGASDVGGSPIGHAGHGISGGSSNSSAVAPRNYAPAGSRRQRLPQGSRKAGGQYALPMIGQEGGGGAGGHHGVGGHRRNRHGGGQRAPHAHISELVTKNERSLHAGVFSIEGLKPGHANWSNQDNYIIHEDVQGDAHKHTWCVFDGHGEHGHHVSKLCRERLALLWIEQEWSMPRSFRLMQAELDKCNIDVRCSGATAVMVAMTGNQLEIGNCGDSRAVLGRKQNGAVVAVLLTSDHKPDRPDERRRVLQAGGQVGCRQLVVGHNASGPITLPLGPARVWYQNRGETMGLAMSRSLGDAVVHTMGVSAEPELTEHTVDGNDHFMIIATDGIWDVIDSNQAVQIVANHAARAAATAGTNGRYTWDVSDAATVLATTARRRWESLSPMVDDITCVVVDLRHAMQNERS